MRLGKKSNNCFECPDFPCQNLEKIDKNYSEKYGASIIKAFRFIQSKGMDEFLKAEREKWKCSTCGGVICVHTKRCYTCNPYTQDRHFEHSPQFFKWHIQQTPKHLGCLQKTPQSASNARHNPTTNQTCQQTLLVVVEKRGVHSNN